MSMKALSLAVMTVIWGLGGGEAAADNAAKEAAAIKVAQTWLQLVDTEQYVESWNAAADYFKNAVTLETWQQALQGTRRPLGQVQSRQLHAAQFMTALPGAPDGEYVVIRYTTSFQHKQSAVETITPMLDKDGQWRVAGYFIK